jgi:hypothetical protein
MGKLSTASVEGASAHGVKFSIGWEEDANEANPGAWQVWTRRPSRGASYSRWILVKQWSADLPLTQCKRDQADREK